MQDYRIRLLECRPASLPFDLLAIKVLRRRFRTLVCNALREAYADGSLVLPAHLVRDATAPPKAWRM